MKILKFLLLSLVPLSVVAQPKINACQLSHFSALKNPDATSQVTDYNVIHYDLYVDSISFGQQQLRCHAGVQTVAELANVSTVSLDLLGFTIDSLSCAGYVVSFSYNDTTIT